MTEPSRLVTEEQILQTLDRTLLRIAATLDEQFDPEDKETVKLLKIFRSLIATRRIWAKEYNLVQIPEPVQKPIAGLRATTTKITAAYPPKKMKSALEQAMDDVTAMYPKRLQEPPPQKNGLMIR